MASSAKRLLQIASVQAFPRSALSSLEDKLLRQSTVLLRYIHSTDRIKESAATSTTGKETITVTMTKTSSSPPQPSQSKIPKVEIQTTGNGNLKKRASTSLLENSNVNDLQSAAISKTAAIQDNDSITITPSAVKQIHHLAGRKRPDAPSNLYLRVYVDAGGCSGFEYKFEIEFKDDEATPIDSDEDVVVRASLSDGSMPVEVVVDRPSLELISGSTVDFVREMIRSSFVISDNPHSESACGCGSSFAVKNFATSGT